MTPSQYVILTLLGIFGQGVRFRPTVTFYSPPGTDVRDTITSNLVIARNKQGNGGGIFNSALEEEWSSSVSPLNTLWRSGPRGNYENMDYWQWNNFRTALYRYIGDNILDTELVMRDTATNALHRFDFTHWGMQEEGAGEFGYTRAQLIGRGARTIQLGPMVQFSNAGNIELVDEVSPGLIIKRDENRGIYNSALEEEYDNENRLSPAGTVWNSQGVASYSEEPASSRYYFPMEDALAGAIGNRILANELIMLDQSTGKYHLVLFDRWQRGGGGEFGYRRWEILNP